mgnify:CR=1 FL=1
MTERLKEIWSGFSAQTERKLTGKGVDNIIVPHRADSDALDRQFLPDGYESPAERAFAALRADLKVKGKKVGRKREKKSAAAEPARSPSAAPDEKAWGKDDLNVGLLSTAMRVERTELDYRQFLSSDEGKKALKRTRKKRFGIF